jgi:hypothetical protein
MPKTEKCDPPGHPNPGSSDSIAPNDIKVAEFARRYTTEALETLAFIMRHDESSSIQMAAACHLLEFGHGRPPVQVDISTSAQVEHVIYKSEAEFRQALLDRGIPARLLPPPLPIDVTESDAATPRPDPTEEPPGGE